MKFASISDLHIKSSHDPSYELFNRFLNYCLENNIDKIGLLGDIFDLMIGPHLEYYERFTKSFELIKMALNNGIEVYYLEGNHDFHLGSLFKIIGFTKFANFKYLKKTTRITLGHKILYISHGDDLGNSSLGYDIYSRFILRGRFIHLLSEIAPYAFVTGIGQAWSRKSRMNVSKKMQDGNVIRQKFRDASQRLWSKKKFDVLIMGHSHIEDTFTLQDGAIVLNNGDPACTRVCAYIDDHSAKLITFA